MNRVALLVIVAAVGFGACRTAPEDDELAVQQAQDRAWGYKRDSAAPAHFLIQNGKGSLAETNAYYAQTVETVAADAPFTLSIWQSQYMTGTTVAGFYRNKTELGFWRDMTCTETIRRGVGGCTVTNYTNETDKAQHRPNQGTVAMNVSPEGFARFYVFLPTGVLSPTAVLDDEGPKFAPRLCTVCHGGGSKAAPATQPDFGSIFREFEPSQLQAQTGLGHADAEGQWFALNQAVRTANESIRGESEGGPAGVDHAKAAMSAHLDGLYPDLAPPARTLTDPALTPVSWQDNATNTKLWNAVVAPSCMGCHRHNAFDWSVYSNFEFLQEAKDGAALLRQYTTGVNGVHAYEYMPQSELGYNRLTADQAAQSAIDAWLPCLAGQTCVPTNPCHQGESACQAGASVCRDTGHAVADGTSCGTGQVCSQGACTSSLCQPNVLLVGDAPASDADMARLTTALGQVGLQPTVAASTDRFTGAETSTATNFGAIVVTPGRTFQSDMPAAGQQAVVAQAARGVGIVFTEWSSYEVTQGHLQQLAPLLLLKRTGTGSTATTRLTFSLAVDDHPVWTGLPTAFTTTSSLAFSVGDPINGGVPIAQVRVLSASATTPTSGVLVREGSGGAGRVVHIAHAASYAPGWEDAQTLRMFTNAASWAAHCH